MPITVLGIILVSGCIQTGTEWQQGDIALEAQYTCISLCEASDSDLSNGPCLSDDSTEWDIKDWVCDVAHDPREAIDNLPENQCQAFRNGEAHHFVEVNTDCEFIRAV
jgi:hypothetical protein